MKITLNDVRAAVEKAVVDLGADTEVILFNDAGDQIIGPVSLSQIYIDDSAVKFR